MHKIILFSICLTLAACGGVGQSKLNPMNWFGKDKEERVETVAETAVDPRPLVAQVLSLRVERVPGGAIIHARGLAETQGYFAAELVPLNGGVPERGTLNLEFRAVPPVTVQPVGPPATREIIVGLFRSDQKLAGVRRIQVIAGTNRRSVKR